MDRLSMYSSRQRNWDLFSAKSCLQSAVVMFACALVLAVAIPDTARADRGFFAHDGEPYWHPGNITGGARSRLSVGTERPSSRAGRRTAAIGAVAFDDDERPQVRRATPPRDSASRPAVKRKIAPNRRVAGTRPRLTPAPTAARANRARLASLGPATTFSPSAPSLPSLSGGLVAWRASASCLASNLRDVIERVASYGRVTVNSTCRNRAHNRRVGGASKSWHLTGNAADLRISGNWRAAAAFMRASVGGFKHYGGGLFHIDNGPKRTF